MKKIQSKIVMILLGLAAVFALSACGGDGEEGAHSLRYLLNGTATSNTAPIADAGIDQNVATGAMVTLDGSGSTDADGDSLTYTWTMTSKPAGSVATLSDITDPKPTFTADLEGEYAFSLVVNDGTEASTAATVKVTATTSNIAPVADAGEDQTVFLGDYYGYGYGDAGDNDSDMQKRVVIAAAGDGLASRVTVELDGNGSRDDGKIAPLTYAWKLADSQTEIEPEMDNNATAKPKVTVTCETAFGNIEDCTMNDSNLTCNYIYTLTVFDGELSDEDNMTLTAVYDRSCFPE